MAARVQTACRERSAASRIGGVASTTPARPDDPLAGGGSPLGAQLHPARKVCRRAERAVTALSAQHALAAVRLVYVNLLSDLLYVPARHANHEAGAQEDT